MKPEETPPPPPHPVPDHKVKYHYFLDGTKYETETSSLNGSDVRAKLPPEKAGYAIFLESQGNEPDQSVSDGDSFSLEKKPLRFYSVPPANFGRE
jgi:hypothetical protein